MYLTSKKRERTIDNIAKIEINQLKLGTIFMRIVSIKRLRSVFLENESRISFGKKTREIKVRIGENIEKISTKE